MKKYFNKCMALLLVLLISVIGMTTLFGCGGSDDKRTKKGKTELKVQIYDGGLGTEWASANALRFEEEFADVSFEEGKTGVYVSIIPVRGEKIDIVISKIKGNTDTKDIYYMESNSLKKAVVNSVALNITDTLTEKVYLEDGELANMDYNPTTGKLELVSGTAPTKSLYDKTLQIHKDGFYLSDSQLDFTGDGVADRTEGFYGFPYEDCASGLIYDHTLFQEQGWLDYEGIDGLPDTEEDFFDLMDRIVEAGIIPLTFSNNTAYYYTRALELAYINQYEGEEGANLNRTYNGTYTFPGDSEPTIITAENAYLLAKQPSKSKLIKFMRKLFSTNYIDPDCAMLSQTYTDVQKSFIYSQLGKPGTKRIAMIFEGEWWENEAKDYFRAIPNGYGSCDYRFFPLPKIEGQKTNNRSIGVQTPGTTAFVNSYTKNPELCKLWIQFTHSKTCLQEQTMINGVTLSYDFDLSEEQLAQMTKFAADNYRVKKGLKTTSNGAKTAYVTYSTTNQHQFYDACPMGGYGSGIGSTENTAEFNKIGYSKGYLAKVFYDASGANGSVYMSADDFINGMYNYYTKINWENMYNAWKK